MCAAVEVEVPKKLIKQATVQHLYGRLNGTLLSDAQEASADGSDCRADSLTGAGDGKVPRACLLPALAFVRAGKRSANRILFKASCPLPADGSWILGFRCSSSNSGA